MKLYRSVYPSTFLPELTMTHSSTDCFVNKTCWNLATTVHLRIIYGCFCATVTELRIVATEPIVFAKPKFDPLWLLYIIFLYITNLQNNAIMFALISFLHVIFKLREKANDHLHVFRYLWFLMLFIPVWESNFHLLLSSSTCETFFSISYLIDKQTTNYFVDLLVYFLIYLINLKVSLFCCDSWRML